MLKTTVHSSLIIIEPQDPMTISHAVTLMDELDGERQMPGIRDIVLDLAKVSEVDGSGLGAVVKVATAARASGQGFYLYRPSDIVTETLNALDAGGFFPILEYEEDLLAHLPD